jgi:hypothetical protein
MPNYRIHSAIVRLWLDSGNERIPLAQVGPDFVISTAQSDRPEVTSGLLVVEVDGHADGRHVRLPEGLNHRDARTPIATLEPSS